MHILKTLGGTITIQIKALDMDKNIYKSLY